MSEDHIPSSYSPWWVLRSRCDLLGKILDLNAPREVIEICIELIELAVAELREVHVPESNQ